MEREKNELCHGQIFTSVVAVSERDVTMHNFDCHLNEEFYFQRMVGKKYQKLTLTMGFNDGAAIYEVITGMLRPTIGKKEQNFIDRSVTTFNFSPSA